MFTHPQISGKEISPASINMIMSCFATFWSHWLCWGVWFCQVVWSIFQFHKSVWLICVGKTDYLQSCLLWLLCMSRRHIWCKPSIVSVMICTVFLIFLQTSRSLEKCLCIFAFILFVGFFVVKWMWGLFPQMIEVDYTELFYNGVFFLGDPKARNLIHFRFMPFFFYLVCSSVASKLKKKEFKMN